MIGGSNGETNVPHKLLLTDKHVSKLHKAFPNNLSAKTNLSETWLFTIGQSGGFLGILLSALLKPGLSLMKNLLKLLAKSVLRLLGLTAAESTADACIQGKTFGLGIAKLINLNNEMEDIIDIVKYLEESGLLIKGASKKMKMRL